MLCERVSLHRLVKPFNTKKLTTRALDRSSQGYTLTRPKQRPAHNVFIIIFSLLTCRTIYMQDYLRERLSDYSTARDHLLCSYSKPLCDCLFHRLSQPGLMVVSRDLYIGACMKTSEKQREGNIYPINSSFSQYKLRAPESQSVKNKFLNLLEALFQ